MYLKDLIWIYSSWIVLIFFEHSPNVVTADWRLILYSLGRQPVIHSLTIYVRAIVCLLNTYVNLRFNVVFHESCAALDLLIRINVIFLKLTWCESNFCLQQARWVSSLIATVETCSNCAGYRSLYSTGSLLDGGHLKASLQICQMTQPDAGRWPCRDVGWCCIYTCVCVCVRACELSNWTLVPRRIILGTCRAVAWMIWIEPINRTFV